MSPVAFTLACLTCTTLAVATLRIREQISFAFEKKQPSRYLARFLNQTHDNDSQRDVFSKFQPCAGAHCSFRTLATLLIALNTVTRPSIENSAARKPNVLPSRIPKDFLCSNYSIVDDRGYNCYVFGNYDKYYTGANNFRSRRIDERVEAVKQWLEEAQVRGTVEAAPAREDVHEEDLHKLTCKVLKEKLKALGLRTGGLKHELISRLQEHVAAQAASLRELEGADEQKQSASRPFNSLSILDIGCNDGQATAQMAKAAEPDGKVLGIDMDASLINRARQQWCKAQSQEDPACQSNLFFENVNMMEVTTSLHPHASRGVRILADFVREAPTLQTHTAHANCLNSADSPAGQFNIIFALSVTKWIHLHYGDLGIMEFFESIYNLLSDSDSDNVQGTCVNYFVLEPQPKRSYESEIYDYRRENPYMQKEMSEIKFRPRFFQAWLEGEINDVSDDSNLQAGRKFAANGGFKLVHKINVGSLDGKARRDLLVFKKRARNSVSESLR